MSVERLQQAMLAYPQIEVETHHQFTGGLYVRTMHCAAGTLIVGKIHKADHFIALLQGKVTVSDETGSYDLEAPVIQPCSSGTRRSLYFHTDSLWANFHRTDATEVEEAEMELVEPDPTSPFLPGNKLPTHELEAAWHS